MAARTTLTQHGFNSGELSPFLAARSDIDRYAYGARSMLNFIPMLQGPARKRPGTKYVHDLKEPCWLLPIAFSQTDSWILAFGDGVVKFFTDHGPVLETAKTVSAITQASPGVITSVAHDFADGDEVYATGIGGMTFLNGRVFIVASATANTFQLVDMWGAAVDCSSAAYTSGGTFARLYKIVSPYAYSDLTDANGCCLLSWAQSEDVTYLCVPGFRQQKLTRTSATSWAFSNFLDAGGPFIGTDPDETVTVWCSSSTGTGRTLTASEAIFESGHVGSLFLLERKLTEITKSWEAGKSIGAAGEIRRSQGHYYEALNSGTTGGIVPSHTEGSRYDGDAGVNWQYLHSGYGWGRITAVGGGGTTATISILSYIPEGAVGSANASTQWSFSSWSQVEGYPTHVCFFRERLCFGRGTKLWFSVPSDFQKFAERDSGVVADDSAISIDIRQGFNDNMQWLMPSSDLLVGAEGNEFAVSEISSADPLGPGNIASLRGPGYGCRRVAPVLINDGVMYALPSGRVVRELRFTFDSDGYQALNRTAFAEHITRGQINSMVFAKEPESIMWSACADGAWVGMSFEREHQLLAWHRHQLGGSAGIFVAPKVLSQAVIPSPTGEGDEVYLCAQRSINSQTKYYLEYLTEHWDEATQSLSEMYYVDAGLSNTANASTVLSGLEHLEGQSVKVLGDGRPLGSFTVTGGAITLTSAPEIVHAGLSYEAELESMNLSLPSIIKRAWGVFVHFVSTVFANAGGATTTDRDTRKLWGPRAIPWTFAGYDVSAPVPAQSRIVKVKGEGDHGREVFFKITHDEPTACTVAGWMLAVEE